MAGLFVARVLADEFRTVTVLERDSLPAGTTARGGVPQGRHVHLLLSAGGATLADLFPGFGEDVVAAGGLIIDGASDLKHYDEGDFLADGTGRIPIYTASRPVFERVVRRRVTEVDGVELRPNCRWTDYLTDDDGVAGVAVATADGEATTLAADLVVDATGRTSRTPTWLADHGFERPETDEVRVNIAYSTVRLERDAGDRRMLFVAPSPPRIRGGAAFPIEDDRWQVTLFGLHGDHPPADADGLTDFAASLPIPHLERLLRTRPLLTDDVAHYPFPTSLRRRYEDLDEFPDGLLVVGDAVSSFNPIYGQGMTVAALEALTLHHALADGRENLAARFFEDATTVVDTAWTLAVGADFAFEGTDGPKPRGTDLTNRYLSRLIRAAHTDSVLRDAFSRVLMLERSPATLFRPGVLWRVFGPTG
jgi:2-polyprenyl-6-methoxyphenol hydroxylase-like FAD-dependent oxidoreductase